MLLGRAENTVRGYVTEGHQFPFFAMALQGDGKVMSFLPSEEFESEREAFVGLLQSLVPQAKSGAITANVLVTPMDPPPGHNDRSALFDLEQVGGSRVLALLPYRNGPSGVEFGQMTFQPAPAKLFAA
jgi:hypothetical protein